MSDSLREALAELVALQEPNFQRYGDYLARVESAWAAARRALADTQPAPEPEDRRAWMKEGHQAQAVASSPEAVGELWALIRAYGAARVDCDRSNGVVSQQYLKWAESNLRDYLAETQRSSSGARSDETNPGLKERPEPALTDEQIDRYIAKQVPDGWEPWFERDAGGVWCRYEDVRAALSHRSTEEPADPEGARDRHAAAAAALLGPGYRLKP